MIICYRLKLQPEAEIRKSSELSAIYMFCKGLDMYICMKNINNFQRDTKLYFQRIN